jgi:hypothetical protein
MSYNILVATDLKFISNIVIEDTNLLIQKICNNESSAKAGKYMPEYKIV